MDRVVIVGASLAGHSAAVQLRRSGFTGSLTVVGDEPHPPYDRTPLSKGVLTGSLGAWSTPLATTEDLDAQWALGVPARALDRRRRQVVLADGRSLAYDRVLISTGRRARPWPDAAVAARPDVVTLRTADDAEQLRALLVDAARVLVVGAGFIGAEVASSCRETGVGVVVVDRAEVPLQSALGHPVGTAAAALWRSRGVDLRTSTTVVSISTGGGAAQGLQVGLSDGSTVDVDAVVVAIGTLANTGWLGGAGLVADEDHGVSCDGQLRALTADGGADDSCYAAGDVVRAPHPVHEGRPVVVEHWSTAVEHGRVAARNMLADEGGAEAVAAVPRFWSNQFGVNIKCVGVPSAADRLVVAQGSLEGRRGVLVYGSGGTTVAAVAVDAPRELEHYARLVEERAPFPPLP